MEISLEENFNKVKDFYLSVNHKNAPTDGDKVLVACDDNGKIIGAVRLVGENGYFLLRTMDVLPEFQKQGIGSKLLESFGELLGNQDCYCSAFGNLRTFYGQIGFKEIKDEEAPHFLQERVAKYRLSEKNKGRELILMKKSKI